MNNYSNLIPAGIQGKRILLIFISDPPFLLQHLPLRALLRKPSEKNTNSIASKKKGRVYMSLLLLKTPKTHKISSNKK